jgi:pimeloyl-ACP methyl ester carboxylesterase/DNA-binding CsgD family transcriptional regulator
VKLAWAEAGAGPSLVKASNWLTHLEYEWESPVWRHWLRFFSEHFRFVRYDERGCGMTDRNVNDLSRARRMADFETVIEAARASAPFFLLGISSGAAVCADYAAAHPDKVAGLILYGGYARGWANRDPDEEREHQAIAEILRVGWGRDNPTFRQLFTSRFVPDATGPQLEWFNELCKKTTSGELAREILLSRGRVDVRDVLGQVRTPTICLHARDDAVCPISEGRLLASSIPGAEFVELDSKNHILLENEPAWQRFCAAVLEFTGVERAEAEPGTAASARDRSVFDSLTARERGILGLLTEGHSNAAIAAHLGLSDKTVRNHVSSVFDKLGVSTRAQAIVFARDRGFRG